MQYPGELSAGSDLQRKGALPWVVTAAVPHTPQCLLPTGQYRPAAPPETGAHRGDILELPAPALMHSAILGKAAEELWTRCLLSPSRVVNRGGFAGVLSISTVSSPQATQSSAYATNSPGYPGRGNPQPKEHFTQQIQNTHLLPRTLNTSQQHDNCCMFHPKLPC